jgi:hypothetical protein
VIPHVVLSKHLPHKRQVCIYIRCPKAENKVLGFNMYAVVLHMRKGKEEKKAYLPYLNFLAMKPEPNNFFF